MTAYFTFSSQMRPALNQFQVYGKKNGLFLDETQQILIRLRGKRLKSYGERFVPALQFPWQYLKNFVRPKRSYLMESVNQFNAAAMAFTKVQSDPKAGSSERTIANGLANLNLGIKNAFEEILKQLAALKAKVK
jgi:hypothetical protein